MQNASIDMQMQKEKGPLASPQNGEMAKAVSPLGMGKNEKKKGYGVVNFHHEENAACKQEVQKRSAVEGLGPLSHPSPLSLLMHVGLMHVGRLLWECLLTSWGSHCLPGSSGSPVNPGKCFSGKWEQRKRRGGWRRTRSPKRCAFLRRQPWDWVSQQFKKRCFKMKWYINTTNITQKMGLLFRVQRAKRWQETCDAIV